MQRICGLLVAVCFTAAFLSGCGGDNYTTTDSMLPSAPDTVNNSSSTYTTAPTQENEIEDENAVDYSSEFEYSLNDDGTATITKYIGAGGEVLIPSMIDGHRVTSIGECIFLGNKNMVDSVVVPDSVTTLESRAFKYCSAKEVILPDSLTELGQSVFSEMVHLEHIDIPDSITTLGPATFSYSALKEITIPESVTTILDGTFSYCKSLTSVTLPSHITEIANSTFSDCTNLSSITIPSGVTRIGTTAFFRCESLTSFVIPDGVTSIGSGLFYECKNLASLTVPASVTDIGEGGKGVIFFGCNKITIHCPAGSAMEQYAIKNDLRYTTE